MTTATIATIKTKISVKDTLLAIPVGASRVIKNKDIPERKVKRGIDYQNSKGLRFKMSVAGRVDNVEVTRLK